MKKWFDGLSIVAKISLVSILACVIIGGTNAVQFNKANETIIEGQKNNFMVNAEALNRAIGAQFYERYGDVQAFAVNHIFQPGSSKADMVEALNNYAALYGIYDLIMLVDSKGNLIAVNDKNPDGRPIDPSKLYHTNFATASWFIETMAGRFTEDKAKGFTGTYFEDANYDPNVAMVYGGEHYGTSFSTQFKDTHGKVIGVITNRANFKWAGAEFKNQYDALQTKGFVNTDLVLINRGGKVVFDFDPASRGGSRDLFYDSSILGKLNLAEVGITAVDEVVRGKSGANFEQDLRKKYEVIVGYTPVNNDKFISSIGWGVMVITSKEAALSSVIRASWQFYITLFLVIALLTAVSFVLARVIGRDFRLVADGLERAVAKTSDISQALSESSTSVASSSAEQSSAIQETVSAVSEIGSMLSQTSQNAKYSLETTQSIALKSQKGRQIMKDMVSSMEAIQQANQQLQSISSIIQEINNKTGVINDIVFKTQLLSFNASIEAARAGQHGRGFAVVAEEVGNLAQMSGNAAKEIQALLNDSEKQVASTLDVIRERVKNGNHVSEEALKGFVEIAESIDGITALVKNIAEASKQQEVGLQQTSLAMGQIDVSAQANNSAAQEASRTAGELTVEGERLREMMAHVRRLVFGSANRVGREPARHGFLAETVEASPLRSSAPMGVDASLRIAERLASKGTKTGSTSSSIGGEVSADDPSFKGVA
jgi:hypothetical protein